MSDIGHYDNHPAYRYQGLVVGDDVKFGRDTDVAGNWEAEAGRGTGWFGGGSIALNDDGANIAGVIFEMFVDEVTGVGYPELLLDSTSWNATKDAIDDFRIGGAITDQQDLRSHLAALSEYFDGWLRRNGTQLELGYWKQGLTTAEVAAIPIIGSDDLTSEPRLKPFGFDDCVTEVTVIFKDAEHFFHETPSATSKNPGLLRILGQHRPVWLQRPFIIYSDLAAQYATTYKEKKARPGTDGQLDVKVEVIEAIEDASGHPIIGQLLKTDIASLGYEIAFRVTDCDYPADDESFCTLTVDAERSIWPTIYIQPPPKKIGNFIVDVPAIVNYKLVELPSGLKTSTELQIAIFGQRPHPSVVGFHVWHSPDDVAYFEDNPPCTFAAYGVLTSSYANSTADVDTTVGMQFELLGVDLVPPSEGHLLDYTVLCFVDNEIMSVGLLQALGGGIYKTWMYRGRYGTTKATHAIGAKAYFILRENIVPIANKSFLVGDTLFFKLQTYDAKQDFDLADFTAFTHLFGGGAVKAPTGLALTTSFVITTERTVDSRITATWSFVADQDLAGFDVRVKRVTFDSVWVTTHVGANVLSQTFKGLEPNKLYEVQVRAIASTGEPSVFSASVQITTAAPNVPGTPTGFALIGGVQAATLKWTNAATGGIRGTQILFSEVLGDDVHLAVIDEVKLDQTSYTRQLPYAASFVFFAVRHVNTVDVEGSRTAALAIDPVVEVAVTKLPAPFIAKATGEAGTAGDDDYRLQLVNTSAGQTADLEFSYNKTTWFLYSETGNYEDGLGGSVLPTGDIGAISLSAGSQLFARQKQDGFLTSELASFYNNTSKTPHDDGTGGGDGTPGKSLP